MVVAGCGGGTELWLGGRRVDDGDVEGGSTVPLLMSTVVAA